MSPLRPAHQRARVARALASIAIVAGGANAPYVLAQQPEDAPPAEERRLLEWAARLDAADRPDEALAVLEQLLRQTPASQAALALLLEIAGRRSRVDPYLPFFEDAAAPPSAAGRVRGLWVDALVAAARVDSAISVARSWAETRPRDVHAHAAWSRAALAAGGPAAAVEILRTARAPLNDPNAFAAELTRAHLDLHDFGSAAEEWIGMSSASFDGAELEGYLLKSGDLREPFSQALSKAAAAAGPAAASAASRLLIRLGAIRRGGELARRIEGRLPPAERIAFLTGFAEDARARGAPAEAAWAAELVAATAVDPERRDRWRAAAADMALQAGDSARARRSFERLVETAPEGSSAHRTAARRLFTLVAETPGRAAPMLAEFERLYPEPLGDLIDMRIELARGFLRDGGLTDAERVLREAGPNESDDGLPVAGLAVELARVRLFAGDAAGALASLERAVADAGADPGTRTSAIRLLAVLRGGATASAAALGRVLYTVARRPSGGEVERAVSVWESSDVSAEAMAVLADELDEANYRPLAAALRERLVSRHPDAPEAPVALLAIARQERELSPHGGPNSPPVLRLERLILRYPESAVAPLARRLRAEWVTSRGPGIGGG